MADNPNMHGQPHPGGETTEESPRWPLVAQPRIPGFATMEWNILQGTTWYSEEWETIVGCEYDPALPNNQTWWEERLTPEDMTKIYNVCLAVHAGFVESSEVVYHLRRGDGEWRTLLSRSKVTARTAEGFPAIASGFCMDITELTGEGLELRSGISSVSEIDYQSMLDNSPDLFVRFDRGMNPVYVNPAVNLYLGGMNNAPESARRLTGDYKKMFQTHVERVFDEKAVVREEVRLKMSDGSEIVGACSFWPEFGPDGAVRFAMMQCRDVTEQRRMALRIAVNERRLNALYRLTLMENATESEVLRFVMDIVMQLSDSRSGFIFVPEEDGSDRGLLFWSDDHYRDFDSGYFPGDHLPPDLIVQMTGQNGERVYRSINNGDGTTPLYVVFGGKMAEMRGIIAPALEGNRVVCVAGVCNRDHDYGEQDLQQLETFINSAWLILRRRRYVHELREAKDAAESANKAKNAFLANVSHELRTPLNGVLSMLQLIEPLPMGREHQGYLQTAQASGKALLRIISDLLDYSGMEAGKMPLDVDFFDCPAILRSTLAMFAEDASRRGLDFSYTLDTLMPRHLLGDEARVRQILFNVVGNALKFTPEGSVTVSCCLAPDAPPGKTGLVLEVADTGIGIPEDKLESIFDAFNQVEATHRRQYAGTGLGLSIVKHLVSMMGGSVSVESEFGKGTVVRCLIFLDFPDAPPVPLAVSPFPADEAPEKSLDILVAEDDAVGRTAIRAFLQRGGHRVLCVEDGVMALEALRAYSFDCVFTDITMPNMDGIELLQSIRAGKMNECMPSDAIRQGVAETFGACPEERTGTGRDVTVIAVSAHSMIGDKDRFLGLGMDYYISKPLDRKELNDALAFVARAGKNRRIV